MLLNNGQIALRPWASAASDGRWGEQGEKQPALAGCLEKMIGISLKIVLAMFICTSTSLLQSLTLSPHGVSCRLQGQQRVIVSLGIDVGKDAIAVIPDEPFDDVVAGAFCQ